MRPETFAWPPPREIRNVVAGRRMAELKTTALRTFDEHEDAPPAPSAESRVRFVSARTRDAVIALLIEARDTGKPLTRGQIRARLRMAEATLRRAMAELFAKKAIVQAGQSDKLTNNKFSPTFRAKHIGEDEPLLTEPPPMVDQLRPYLIRARETGQGITRQQLAEEANAVWSTVANTLVRMRASGLVVVVGRAACREGGLTTGRKPLLYMATEKL